GITGTAEYGLIAGTYAATNGQFFRASDQNFDLHGINFSMWDGATEVIKFNRTAPSFALGSPLPSAYGTGTGIWMGKDGAAYKFRVGNPATTTGLFWDGSTMTVAGWTVNSTSIQSGTTYIASGLDTPAGQVAWFGKSATGYQGWTVRDASGRFISSVVGNGA